MDLPSNNEEVIDGHAHPCVNSPTITVRDFSFSFSESDDENQLRDHVPSTVTMMAAVRYLAQRVGVEPTPAALATYRNQVGLATYAQQLLRPENVRCILLDTGYPKNGLSVAESEQALGVPCKEIVRIETLAEALLPDVSSSHELLDELEQRLRSVDVTRVVAFKTIAAYRCGLGLSAPSEDDLRAAFAAEKCKLDDRGFARLTARPLISAIVERALAVAHDLGLPLQLHTGFGDRDLVLSESNPWLLRPLLEDARFREVPFVLLHCAYPFVREAGILAALYPNVFIDLSLAVPLTAHGARRILLELLEQAPLTKLMYGSDASVGPELLAWGAAVGRSAVRSALQTLVDGGWLTRDEAAHGMRLILAENAKRLYRL
jgi:uncharacterized protein